MVKIAQKTYCVVLIKDFEDSLKLNIPDNKNYDCIEIDANSNISDDEFLTKTQMYEKIVFVLEVGSRKASIFLRYAMRLINKECIVITNIPFKYEGQRKRNNALEALEYLLTERANVEIIKCDAIANKLSKGATFAQAIEACRDEFVYIINETTKI